MTPDAIKYLHDVCDPLTKHGVEVIQDELNPLAIAVVPKSATDYGSLCGVKGANASNIRQIFKIYCGVHGIPVDQTNVQIANPNLIKTEHI